MSPQKSTLAETVVKPYSQNSSRLYKHQSLNVHTVVTYFTHRSDIMHKQQSHLVHTEYISCKHSSHSLHKQQSLYATTTNKKTNKKQSLHTLNSSHKNTLVTPCIYISHTLNTQFQKIANTTLTYITHKSHTFQVTQFQHVNHILHTQQSHLVYTVVIL